VKSIADFLASKIRRAELTEDQVRLVRLAEAHETLGAPEATVDSDHGSAAFFAHGFTAGTEVVRYDEIERIERTENGAVDVVLPGRTLRIHTSTAGAIVVFDTLRWVGRALLRRRLD
jgi:hypothetical protein